MSLHDHYTPCRTHLRSSAACICLALGAGLPFALMPSAALAACTMVPAPAGFAAAFDCTGTTTAFSTSVANTFINLPDGANKLRDRDTIPLTIGHDGAELVVGNGASIVRQSSTTSNLAAIDITGENATITVKSGGLITNNDASRGSEAIYLHAGADNATITVEEGGRIRAKDGEAVRTTLAATGLTLTNHGLISNNGTAPDRLIHVFEATVINEATGEMRQDANDRPAVGLENGGTLINRGTINQKGTGTAVEGDDAAAEVERIVNSGTIKTQGGTAIDLFDGDDIVVLEPGFNIVGDVVAGLGTDTLEFGGSGTAQFKLNQIDSGKQYKEFETFIVSGGTWEFSKRTDEIFTVTGGTVAGNGQFGGLIMNGGILSPGDSVTAIASMRIKGILVMNSGATYRASLDAAGQSDLVEVTQTATLNSGAALAIEGAMGSYPSTSPIYTILTAKNGVTGTFGTVTDDLPDLDFEVEYRSNDIRLTYTEVENPEDPKVVSDPGTEEPTTTSTTPGNEVSPKDVHATSVSGAGAAGNNFLKTVFMQGGGRNGAARAGGQRLSFKDLPGTLSVSSQSRPKRDMVLWATGLGQRIDVGATGGLSAWTSSTAGLAIGVDASPDIGIPMIATAAAGFSRTQTVVGTSTSDIDTRHLAVSTHVKSGAWQFGAGLSYGAQTYENTRRIPVGAGTATAMGRTDGSIVSVNLETFYDMAAGGASARQDLSFGPIFGLDWSRTRQSGYSETGAGILNLDVAGSTTTQSAARLGFAGSLTKAVNGADVTFSGLLAVERNFGDLHSTTVATLPVTGQQFVTQSAPIGEVRGIVGLGMNFELGARTQAFVSYEGRLDNRTQDHRAAIGIAIKF